MFALRLALPADVDAVRALVLAAYEGYVPRIGLMPAPMTADYDRSVRDGRVFVAVDHDEIAGLVVIDIAGDHLLLENIATHPAMQGRGIGSQLLDFVEEQARRHGVPEIRLYTHVAMTENLAFYGRRGYVETHRAREHDFERVFLNKRVEATSPTPIA